MSIKKSIFKIFNGTSWDEYHHKTSADQVVYTKADGTASNVQKELDAQNSTLGAEHFNLTNNSGTIINNETRRAFGIYDKSSKSVRIYAQCNFSANNTLENTFRIPDKYNPHRSIPCICGSTDEAGVFAFRPGWVSTGGYLTAAGSTSLARSVIYLAEYQLDIN